MKITVEIDSGLVDRLRRGGDRADMLMLDGLDRLGEALVTQARVDAGSGPYGRSFSSTRDGRHAVVAGSRSPLAAIIEKGRKPGRRPPAVRGKLSAEAADRIARSGTKGRYVVRNAAARLRSDGVVDRVARDVVARVAEG